MYKESLSIRCGLSRLSALVFTVGFVYLGLLSGASAQVPGPAPLNALLVANGYYDQEDDIHDHLLGLGIDVTIKKDYKIYGTTDLDFFDLIIITGFAPNISNNGLNNIKGSGKPVLIVEYWDFWYSYKMGLLNWDSGDFHGDDTVELITDQHYITAVFDQTVQVYDSWYNMYGASLSSVKAGVTPLVYSWPSANEAAVLVDETGKIASTGIYDTTRYTADGWKLFDRMISFLILPRMMTPAGKNILFVSNGTAAQETALSGHLDGFDSFNVFLMDDTQVSAGTDLSTYDAIIISGFSPNISDAGLGNINSSGKPVMILEHMDCRYSYQLGLLKTDACGAPADDSIVPADPEALGDFFSEVGFVRALFDELDVYQTSSGIYGALLSDLEDGVLPLFHNSNSSSNTAVFADADRKVLAMGVSDVTLYDDDAWLLFDIALNYLSKLGPDWNSSGGPAFAYSESGLKAYIDDFKADPESYLLDEVASEVWRAVVDWNLFSIFNWISSDLASIGAEYLVPGFVFPPTFLIGETALNTQHDVRGLDPEYLPNFKAGVCTPDGPDPTPWCADDLWFMGYNQNTNGEGVNVPNSYGGRIDQGTDYGISVHISRYRWDDVQEVWIDNSKTIMYMGDTASHPSPTDCKFVCNDAIAVLDDNDYSDGIDAKIYTDDVWNQNRFKGIVIKGVNDTNGALTQTDIGEFNVPTGVAFSDEYAFWTEVGGKYIKSENGDYSRVWLWYGTHITGAAGERKSWLGCSRDGVDFGPCYPPLVGPIPPADPFSTDKFIIVSPVTISHDLFEVLTVWYCDEQGGAGPWCGLKEDFDDEVTQCSSSDCPYEHRGGMLLLGAGEYRNSPLYMAYLHHPTGDVWYYTGDNTWVKGKSNEDQAVAIVEGGPDWTGFGEMSVKGIPHWKQEGQYMYLTMFLVLLYNPTELEGHARMRTASIFRPDLWSDTISTRARAMVYGTYMVDSDDYVDYENGELELYHTLSTWRPYGVFTKRLKLQNGDNPPWPPDFPENTTVPYIDMSWWYFDYIDQLPPNWPF